MKTYRSVVVAAGATLLLSACGGGSGSQTVSGTDDGVADNPAACFTALRSEITAKCAGNDAPSLPGTITPSSLSGGSVEVDVVTPGGGDVTLGGPVNSNEQRFVNRAVSTEDYELWICGGEREDEVVAIPMWVNANGEKFGALAFAGDEEAVAADWGANGRTVAVASAYDAVYLNGYRFTSTSQWAASLESDRFDAAVTCYLFDQDGNPVEGEAIVEPTVAELLVNGDAIDQLVDEWHCSTSSDEQYTIAFANSGQGLWVFEDGSTFPGSWEMTGDDSLRYTIENGGSVEQYDLLFEGYHDFSGTLEIGESTFGTACSRYDMDGNRVF